MQASQSWNDFKRPVNIVAIGLGAIGLIFGIVSWYLSQRISQITFQIVQISVFNATQAWPGTESSAGGSLTIPSPFTVLDRNGKKITQNIYAAEITVWNSGDIELGEGKIRIPLTIVVQGDPKLLDRSISRVTNDEAQITLKEGSDRSATTILWKYFDPGMGFRLRIIYVSDRQRDITVQANILGIRNIIDRNAYQKSWTTHVKAIGAVILVVVIGAIPVIALARAVDKRYVYGGKRMSPATLIVTVALLLVLLMGSFALGIWGAYELLRPPVLPF